MRPRKLVTHQRQPELQALSEERAVKVMDGSHLYVRTREAETNKQTNAIISLIKQGLGLGVDLVSDGCLG